MITADTTEAIGAALPALLEPGNLDRLRAGGRTYLHESTWPRLSWSLPTQVGCSIRTHLTRTQRIFFLYEDFIP